MSSAMARVYRARHGRTALPAERRLRWLSDPPRDELGRDEVAPIGRCARHQTSHRSSVDSAPGRSAGRPLFAERAVRACLALTAELAPTGSVSARGEARNSVLESAEPVDGSRQVDDCDRVAI